MQSQLRMLILLVAILFLTSCQSKREQLADMCTDLSSVSKMTDNCSNMASSLMPITLKYNALVGEIGATVDDEAERIQYIDVVSKCQRMYLEIATGPCGSDNSVQNALPFDVAKN